MTGLLLLGTARSQALADVLPPAQAFGILPVVSDVSISPDGQTLAWNDGAGEEPRVVMFDLQKRKFSRYLKIDPAAKLRGIRWADNETILVTVSVSRDMGAAVGNWSGHDRRHWEVFRTIAADKSNTPGRILLMSDPRLRRVTGVDLVSWRTSKPKKVLMATLNVEERWESDAPTTYSLFEVDTVSGKGRLMQKGTLLTDQWVTDGSGERIARAEWDYSDHAFTVQVLRGSDWTSIFHREGVERLTLNGFSADATALIATGAIGGGRSKLWRLPLDGSEPKPLLEESDIDMQAVSLDPYTGAPRVAWTGGAVPQARWLDSGTRTRAEVLARAFAGRTIEGYETSQKGDRAVVEVSGPSRPPVYYIVDFHTGKADIVGEEYPALASAALGERRVISYKSRDGQDIPAYLTLPPGAGEHQLPLVVLPHGGPEARDYPTFDWWSQFLATRGYVVLQPQFRGSVGFGEDFRKAGYRQWGGRMQDDLSDGVADLISRGLVDPSRVCIVGGSYGGYAALAGVVFTPNLYKCAVSVNGVSDLAEMLAYVGRRRGSAAIQYWREHIGEAHDRELLDKSPAHAADRIAVPVLLMHASEDTVVPFSQSAEMAHALEKMHKPVTLVALPGEDHWLSRSETRTRVLEELETFLHSHL